METKAVERPVLYLLVALALGPVYAWTVVSAARFLPWAEETGWFFGSDPQEHVLAFTLACLVLAWTLRHRIVRDTGVTTFWRAALCSVLGGPVYLAFHLFENLIRVPGQLHEGPPSAIELVVTPLFLSFMAVPFELLFLPVTLPLTWCSLHLLRLAAGARCRSDGWRGSNFPCSSTRP